MVEPRSSLLIACLEQLVDRTAVAHPPRWRTNRQPFYTRGRNVASLRTFR
jgi:hypothetical protein